MIVLFILLFTLVLAASYFSFTNPDLANILMITFFVICAIGVFGTIIHIALVI